MQSHQPLGGSLPPTSFLSLPFELREPIYRLILRSLPRIRPMLYNPIIPIYRLQHLDPRPLFVHPQIQHDIEALLVSHTRILIPLSWGWNNESPLGGPTETWLRETSIEFKRIRVWSSGLPIILDLNTVTDTEVEVHYRWRYTPGGRRLNLQDYKITHPTLPIMFRYLAEGLRKRIDARGGTGIGIEEIEFWMKSMSRFFAWYQLHRRLDASNPRLSAVSYERKLDSLYNIENEDKEDLRRHLEWWDDIEAEVRVPGTIERRVKLP